MELSPETQGVENHVDNAWESPARDGTDWRSCRFSASYTSIGERKDYGVGTCLCARYFVNSDLTLF